LRRKFVTWRINGVLPPINEFKPPYQPKNNAIREDRENGDLTVFRGERRS
jgi:hypothetical protein